MIILKMIILEISQNFQKNTYARLSFLTKKRLLESSLLKKTLAQVVSCEFCKISKNTFFTENFRATASEFTLASSQYIRKHWKIVILI